ncbi:MAG: LD-carboxypeptidase [Solobacterium sp.]|nr:LD-carboxypeptidase [Solobacterium sp.]
MKYPTFIKKNSTIGICAPSAGVGRKIQDFDNSLKVLKTEGYQIYETPSVRVNDVRSADAKTRTKELHSLFNNKKIDMVMCAAGGDFLFEMLPEVNWNTLVKHPKWMMGASDPTSLLFTYTTKYDVATLYGCNAGSYANIPFHDCFKDNLELLKGNLVSQISFTHINSSAPFSDEPSVYDLKSSWNSTHKTLHVSGRCIGGCMDVLKDLIGTEYDHVSNFIKKYHKDGFIWYFDNFALSAETFYNTLLQMKYAGWFKYTKAIIIGRTIFPSENIITYDEAILKALNGIPVLSNADVGHTLPHMTMINGAILDLTYKRKKATLKFSLK